MFHIKPRHIHKYFAKTVSVLVALFAITFIYAAYLVYNAPHDYLQGLYVKIMYIHVPSAWLAMGMYSIIAFASVGYLVFKNPFYFSISKSIAPIGCGFTLITLLTGAIWGKPTWGTWWVWDARLTSMLILFFIYIGHIGLAKSFEEELRAAYVSSVFAIIGFINIPIIKFSVDLWNTLHQPSSVLRLDGPTIHASMLRPLLFFTLNLIIFSCILILVRLKTDAYRGRLSRLEYRMQDEN
jgi:heme exporter protein C